MNCGVYQIENSINGKRYIGSSNQVRRRFYLHKWDLGRGKHHSITLQRAWNKYGESAFLFKPILYCSVDDLHFYEQRYLDKMETVDPSKGFNICCDASAAGMGRVWTAAQREAKSIERKGKKVGPEALQNLINSRKHGADHWLFGKHHTEQTRKKISASRKGITAWNKGKPQHPANSQAKITPEIVLEIRNLIREAALPRYSRKLSTFERGLGVKYSLKFDTIYSIAAGLSWPDVGGLPCLRT